MPREPRLRTLSGGPQRSPRPPSTPPARRCATGDAARPSRPAPCPPPAGHRPEPVHLGVEPLNPRCQIGEPALEAFDPAFQTCHALLDCGLRHPLLQVTAPVVQRHSAAAAGGRRGAGGQCGMECGATRHPNPAGCGNSVRAGRRAAVARDGVPSSATGQRRDDVHRQLRRTARPDHETTRGTQIESPACSEPPGAGRRSGNPFQNHLFEGGRVAQARGAASMFASLPEGLRRL